MRWPCARGNSHSRGHRERRKTPPRPAWLRANGLAHWRDRGVVREPRALPGGRRARGVPRVRRAAQRDRSARAAFATEDVDLARAGPLAADSLPAARPTFGAILEASTVTLVPVRGLHRASLRPRRTGARPRSLARRSPRPGERRRDHDASGARAVGARDRASPFPRAPRSAHRVGAPRSGRRDRDSRPAPRGVRLAQEAQLPRFAAIPTRSGKTSTRQPSSSPSSPRTRRRRSRRRTRRCRHRRGNRSSPERSKSSASSSGRHTRAPWSC